ncbi:MAG: glycoside hydrolase family 13 protein, partial [Oscillospiraceae bacterium]|nr:glycoside hydrolase family 13 protein [Oscillospiraceae bacterium]
EFQLTVYNDSKAAPQWFGAGVTYQIFPDRFCRGRDFSAKNPLPPGRRLHESWEDVPDFRPDREGNIVNRDFFGGSLSGILEKLPYLKKLGVDTLYLNPIFEAAENHRYGTGDYESIDPLLGDMPAFEHLCAAVHDLDMKIILDGVFSHTGFQSRYFNGDGSYPDVGASQSRRSPYYPWYRFGRWPDEYESWWGISTLPEVNELEPSYERYIIGDENSIVRRYLKAGADGWRLDVADELPDAFVRRLNRAARETKKEAVVIGEVWEDGSNKISYGVRRRHLLGGYLDGLMNYPFRASLLSYLRGGDASDFRDQMETLREHYPPFAFYGAMNLLGTHDTPRILTLLGGGEEAAAGKSREEKSVFRLPEDRRRRGISLLRLAFLILFSFPGSPTVYYGDEAGMEGLEDPFNRRTFPWGREDQELVRWVSLLGRARHALRPLQKGDIRYLAAGGPLLCFSRTLEGESVLTAVNRGDAEAKFRLPWNRQAANDVLTQAVYLPENGVLSLSLPPRSGLLLAKSPQERG